MTQPMFVLGERLRSTLVACVTLGTVNFLGMLLYRTRLLCLVYLLVDIVLIVVSFVVIVIGWVRARRAE